MSNLSLIQNTEEPDSVGKFEKRQYILKIIFNHVVNFEVALLSLKLSRTDYDDV